MNSIDKNQPEDNFESLQGTEAIKKIKELTEKASTCFFCTKIVTGEPFSTRPMTILKTDDHGVLHFLCADDSHQYMEVSRDPSVQVLMQGETYSEFLELYGKVTISKDKNLIKELWNPMFKTWFIEGENDPRITVLLFKPEEGYYWDTKNNRMIGILKRTAGAIIGKTLDDSVHGTIKV